MNNTPDISTDDQSSRTHREISEILSEELTPDEVTSLQVLVEDLYKLEEDFHLGHDLSGDPQFISVQNLVRGTGGVYDIGLETLRPNVISQKSIHKLVAIAKVIQLLHRRAVERKNASAKGINPQVKQRIKLVTANTVEDAANIVSGGGRDNGHININNKLIGKCIDLRDEYRAQLRYDPHFLTMVHLVDGAGGSTDICHEFSDRSLQELSDINALVEILFEEAKERFGWSKK